MDVRENTALPLQNIGRGAGSEDKGHLKILVSFGILQCAFSQFDIFDVLFKVNLVTLPNCETYTGEHLT